MRLVASTFHFSNQYWVFCPAVSSGIPCRQMLVYVSSNESWLNGWLSIANCIVFFGHTTLLLIDGVKIENESNVIPKWFMTRTMNWQFMPRLWYESEIYLFQLWNCSRFFTAFFKDGNSSARGWPPSPISDYISQWISVSPIRQTNERLVGAWACDTWKVVILVVTL